MNDDRAVAAYLRSLGGSIRGLAPGERQSVLREIESHIEERIARGSSADQVLSALGPPEALATAYIDQDELYRALAKPSPAVLLGALLNRATRSGATFVAALAGFSSFAFALSFLAIATAKIIAPSHVGYWRTPTDLEFGIMASPPVWGTERLGLWIIPIALFASVIFYLAGMTLLRRRASWLVRHLSILPLA